MIMTSRLWRLFLFVSSVVLSLLPLSAQSPTLTTVAEVRWSDTGWGPNNDQNLAGRFTSQTFTLPRLGKTQDYYLRQFDGSTPPKYSRYSAALHVDYPY